MLLQLGEAALLPLAEAVTAVGSSYVTVVRRNRITAAGSSVSRSGNASLRIETRPSCEMQSQPVSRNDMLSLTDRIGIMDT